MKIFIEMTKNQMPLPIFAAAGEKALDKSLKARNPNLYYRNLHIECYYFCQQYENHFKIAGPKRYMCVFFVAIFLKDRIFFH